MIRMHWEIDPRKKLIFLKKDTTWAKIMHFFGFPKQSVNIFYSGLIKIFSTVEGIRHEIPIKAEGDRKSTHRKPRYFLVNEWKISQEDIRHLKKGPLTDETGNELLVEEYSLWKKFKMWIKDFGPFIIDVVTKIFVK